MNSAILSVIHQRAVAAANGFRRAEAELLDALAEVEGQKVFQQMGYPSLFVYATEGLRLTESVSYAMITVMRKSREVPELRERIASGELSVSTAKKMVSVLTPENQSVWLSKASDLTTRQLEKEVARENPRAATVESAKYVSGDRLAVHLGANESLMLKLRRVQDLVSGSIQAPATLEATLEVLAEFYLQHKDPVRKAERVVAKKGLDTRVSAPDLKPVDENSPREPSTRTSIPARVEHAVHLRDQGKCQAPLPSGRPCHSKRWVELHHIHPVVQGGRHELANLITLCSAHHDQHHQRRHAHPGTESAQAS